MKRITLALLLALSVTMAVAQPKTPADAQKAVDKALAASQDAKKALKPATWITLADAYIAAYDQPTKSVLQNSSQMEVKMFLKDQKILNTSERKGAEGAVYTVDEYADKDLYYNESGVLDFWIVTKPAVEGDLLGEAQKALLKAYEIDEKKSKAKDIAEKLEGIHQRLNTEAFAYYLSGDAKKASEYFKKTTAAYDNPVLNKFDSINVYYTGMVASFAQNHDLAIESYKACAEKGFYQDGNVFSNLADIYRQKGDTTSWKAVLEQGFEAYPQSQGILVGLINLYRETGDNPQKMFDLLHQAQANEPSNASLFYVEGDIYKQLGEVEKAEEMYIKSSSVDPKYFYGFLGCGILYYEKAVDIQNEASEVFDDAKYMELNNLMEATLKKSIEPFEKAFSIAEAHDVKVAIAEYLKNIYFRLRGSDESYPALYEKYNNFMKGVE